MNTTTNNTNKAVIYCRVSTKEQVEEGNSLVSQEKLCKEYAFKNGLIIDRVFIEEGESAKNAERPQLQNLLKYCSDRKNGIKAVIAYKLDRISRNTDDYSQIRILLKRYNVEIKSTSEHFENTPAGRFMENIIANVAQFDNDVRTERSVGGMREAMYEGRYVWNPPMGYSKVRINGVVNVEPNDKSDLIISLFNRVAENSRPLDQIRKEFANKGLVTKTGEPLWKGYFHKILRNVIYKGHISKFGETHMGIFKPLVEEKLFDQVQLVIKHRSKINKVGYKLTRPDFPLRRFILHPSGRKITGGWSKGRTKKYAYYSFPTIPGTFAKSELECKFISYFNSYSVPKHIIEKLFTSVKENFSSSTMRDKQARLEIENKIQLLNTDKRKLIQKNLNDTIADDLFKEHIHYIEGQIIDLESKLLDIQTDQSKLPKAITFAKLYMKEPGTIWNMLSVDKKLQLQGFNFPLGITFDGNVFRTAQIANVLKLKSFFLTPMSPIVPKKIPNLNHQNRYNKLLDVANNSVSPPVQEKFTLRKDRILEFDWKVFFGEIMAIQDMLDEKEKVTLTNQIN